VSTDIIPFSPGAIPAHIRDAGQSDLTKELMQSIRSGRRISIRGKMFRLVVGGEEIAKRPQSIDVIIVNVAKDISRTYYEGAYDPKAEAVPPTCWSADSKVPHPSVENPQHRNCNDCPMNVKGSGQGQSRACRFKRRVAVVLADSVDSGVHMLELPATSLFGDSKGDITRMPYEQYFKYVASLGHSIDRIVTRMSFDEDSDSPKLFFSPIGFPSAEMMPKLAEYGSSLEAKSAITMTVYQADRPKLPVPEQEAAPTVKATRKEPSAPTGKKDLNDVLGKFARKSVTQTNDTEVDDE